jgi:aminopeptidase
MTARGALRGGFVMKDQRLTRLANILVNHSCRVRPGEKVLISNVNAEPAFVRELVDAVYDSGGLPFVSLFDREIERSLLMRCGEDQLRLRAKHELDQMRDMDCYIGFTSLRNNSAFADVPQDRLDLYNRIVFDAVHIRQRVPKTRWVVLRYPSPSMAQLAGMSEAAFEDFYFDVCAMDYGKMSVAMDPLVSLLERTDRVRIVAPGTELEFSIRGMPAIKCDGGRNIPDGEVYTAPIKGSVNGTISYNAPSLRDGFAFEGIKLVFKDGKIVGAESNDSARLNAILDTDGGARYVGEFALGMNPFILNPMRETLFDEKIAGSLHFTPGNAYDTCDNGNRSAVHWDLVLIQRPEWGGGEIWLDGRLVRKDGLFVVPELGGLNPDRLKG